MNTCRTWLTRCARRMCLSLFLPLIPLNDVVPPARRPPSSLKLWRASRRFHGVNDSAGGHRVLQLLDSFTSSGRPPSQREVSAATDKNSNSAGTQDGSERAPEVCISSSQAEAMLVVEGGGEGEGLRDLGPDTHRATNTAKWGEKKQKKQARTIVSSPTSRAIRGRRGRRLARN